jgi:hypothetical protein
MPMDAVDENADEDEVDPDERRPQRIWDKHVAPETELSDSYVIARHFPFRCRAIRPC